MSLKFTELSPMDFSEALLALKRGESITRKAYTTGPVFLYRAPDGLLEFRKMGRGGDISFYWTPSRPDLLATDWRAVL